MTTTDDVQGYRRKYSNQLDKLAESGISDRDKDAIREYINHRDVNTDCELGVLVSHLNRLRLSSERADQPLVEMAEISDVNSLFGTLKREHGLSEGTRRNYKKAVRAFFEYHGRDWYDDISVGSPTTRSVDPDKLLSMDEINDLIDAADGPRDKALVALLADTGMRIGAVAALRVRDVDLSGSVATVSLNENANNKGAEGSTILTWSRSEVSNWLDNHPRRNDPDVALFHKLERYEEDDDGAMTYHYLSRRIRTLGEEAGIDSDRLNAHNFRKSAISRWIREGMSEQKIKHRAFWVKDSSQFEVYSGVTDEEMNDEVAAHYGIETSDDTTTPTLDKCPTCSTPLRDGQQFCGECGAPISQSAVEDVNRARERTFDEGVSADSEASAAREIQTRLEDDPELASAILNAIDEHQSS